MRRSISPLFLIFVILYLVSPIDAVPGPVDDLLLSLFTFLPLISGGSDDI